MGASIGLLVVRILILGSLKLPYFTSDFDVVCSRLHGADPDEKLDFCMGHFWMNCSICVIITVCYFPGIQTFQGNCFPL